METPVTSSCENEAAPPTTGIPGRDTLPVAVKSSTVRSLPKAVPKPTVPIKVESPVTSSSVEIVAVEMLAVRMLALLDTDRSLNPPLAAFTLSALRLPSTTTLSKNTLGAPKLPPTATSPKKFDCPEALKPLRTNKPSLANVVPSAVSDPPIET